MNDHQCRQCLVTKPVAAFTPCRGKPHIYCRDCRNENARCKTTTKVKPSYYADSADGKRQRQWQALLNNVPAYARGNLSAVVRTCGVAA